MSSLLRKNRGITLIELLVAMVISAILVGGIYRTFIGQQKTYTVQEQVVDIQQNVRAAINRMTTEVRMAGFGHVDMLLPAPYASGAGVTIGGRTYNDIVNPNIPVAGSVTILSGTGSTTLTEAPIGNQIKVASLTDGQGNTLFDTGNRKYISIGGVESYSITNITGAGPYTLTLGGTLTYSHLVGTPVYGIRAVTYQLNGLTLVRDENMGAGGQPMADNIENLQFGYFDENGNPPAQSADIRVVLLSLRGRASASDPDYKTDGGYRKRQITSSIHLKNMGLEI